MTTKKTTKEIPLEDWASSFSEPIPHRTAKSWAKNGVIPAELKSAYVNVTIRRRVRKYFIPKGTPKPSFVK